MNFIIAAKLCQHSIMDIYRIYSITKENFAFMLVRARLFVVGKIKRIKFHS